MEDWKDLNDDELNDSLDFDANADDTASDLIREEEENNSSNDDDNEVNVNNKIALDSDSDVNLPFSSLTLNDSNSLPIDHLKLLGNIFELMKKTRLIVKFIRNHNATNEYFNKHILSSNNDNKTGGLILDMIIRWNSSFLLLDRLISHKDVLNSMLIFPNNIPGLTEKQRQRLKELTLNQHELELLNTLKDILEPFFDATKVLSGQRYPSMLLAFYVYRLLSCYLESTANDGPITIGLKQVLNYWFNFYFHEKLPLGQMQIMMIAGFLDPTIYNLLDDKDRRSAKKAIFRKLPSSSIHLTTLSSLSTLQTTTTATKLNSLQKLAAACGRTLPSSTTTKSQMTLDEEISNYIKAAKSANNFQQFWIDNGKQLPRLAHLVRVVNVIPATSISSESLFSVANFIQRKQRASLSSQTLRYLLVLKNRHVIDELEQNYS